ncbi:uncharacterized protein TNCV_1785281 [Trichonephila clavipes]|nr:uncharacterized protein TNCV_1785281 [Trichonephila clavipes]
MPVVSDSCSCLPDCLVCGRRAEPTHDCAIHVLLKLMVFQERMLHGEPIEAKLEEILQNEKEYLPLDMHKTDKNSVRWQTMNNYVKNGFSQHQGNSSRNPPDLDSHYLEQEAAKGKGAFIQALWTHYAIPKLYDCYQRAQTLQFSDKSLDRARSTDSSSLDSIGSNDVAWAIWADMARYRVSSARCMPHLPHYYTQARKNTVWTCVSQKVPFTVLGHLQHLSLLQSIVDRLINTMLSSRKMGK